MSQLKDLDNTLFFDYVSNELKQNFDRLDLRKNYSIFSVPGYLGSNAVLDKWSKITHENKTVLLTDFQDLETPDDVIDIFFNANHTGGDVHKSNTIMTCNYLLGISKYDEVGEEDNLYVPPSTSLAGKIYKTLMSQVVAGKKFGGLNEVESVRFDLKKSEISELEKMGLVPSTTHKWKYFLEYFTSRRYPLSGKKDEILFHSGTSLSLSIFYFSLSGSNRL